MYFLFIVVLFSINNLNAKDNIVGIYNINNDPNFIQGKIKDKKLYRYKIFGKEYCPKLYKSYNKTGLASWYGKDDNFKNTANQEVFYGNILTAAHRTLPINSIVKVTNLENNLSVILRINDRGPYADTESRIIDLSESAAKKLKFYNKGLAVVTVELLSKETHNIRKMIKNKISNAYSKDNLIKNKPTEKIKEQYSGLNNSEIEYFIID